MATTAAHALSPSAEQSRIAAQQHERARQAINSHNFDYGIELLQTCCKIDPSNLVYRKALRRTAKIKYRDNMRGSALGWLTSGPARLKLKAARRSGNYRRVLECGELVLARNPWHTGVQLAMSEAADKLSMIDVAVWILEQARQKNPMDARVNRPLATMYEKQGNFAQAIAMWDLVAKVNPKDDEASRKGKDLAATNTIVQGHYEEMTRSQDNTASFRETQGLSPTQALQGQQSREVEMFRQRITSDPTNPTPYLQLCGVYQKMKQQEQGRRVLEEGLVATNRNFELQIALSELEIEPFRQNLTLTQEKLKTRPEDEELRKLRVRLLKEINTREMEVLRLRADRFPNDYESRLELGIRLLRANLVEEAIQELQVARKTPRNRWRSLLYLGYAFQGKKNSSLAKRNFNEALQSLPAGEEESRKELLYQLAIIAGEEKDFQTALNLGNDLANLDYGHKDIGKLLDDWNKQLEQKR